MDSTNSVEIVQLLLTGVTAALLTQIIAWMKDAWRGRAEKREKQRECVATILRVTIEMLQAKQLVVQEMSRCETRNDAAAVFAQAFKNIYAPIESAATEIIQASFGISDHKVYSSALDVKIAMQNTLGRLAAVFEQEILTPRLSSAEALARCIDECYAPLSEAHQNLITATEDRIALPKTPIEWFLRKSASSKKKLLREDIDQVTARNLPWLEDFLAREAEGE